MCFVLLHNSLETSFVWRLWRSKELHVSAWWLGLPHFKFVLMSGPIMFWQHLSPAIPHFGQQDPRLMVNWHHLPFPPKTPSLKQRISARALKPAVGSGKVGILVQALPCVCDFLSWSIKMFQSEQDLQMLTDSDRSAICTFLFSSCPNTINMYSRLHVTV